MTTTHSTISGCMIRDVTNASEGNHAAVVNSPPAVRAEIARFENENDAQEADDYSDNDDSQEDSDSFNDSFEKENVNPNSSFESVSFDDQSFEKENAFPIRYFPGLEVLSKLGKCGPNSNTYSSTKLPWTDNEVKVAIISLHIVPCLSRRYIQHNHLPCKFLE